MKRLKNLLGVLVCVIVAKANSKKVTVSTKAKINFRTKFEGFNAIGDGSKLSGTTMGMGSYCGADCSITGSIIGRFCCIANDVKIISYSHPYHFVSMHPAFYSPLKQAGFTYTNTRLWNDDPVFSKGVRVLIGSDVWIGAHVRIKSGVSIGSGSVIAAGSVVVRDVEPYTIVGGVPAKQIKKRFDDRVINFLMEFEWWNKDMDWIKENSTYFLDMDDFLSKFCAEPSNNGSCRET